MLKKKYDLAIINRRFWPQSQVLGEALLRLSENEASQSKVCAITQSEGALKKQLEKGGRGKNVDVMDRRSRSDSSSSLTARVLDAIGFMFWVVFSLLKARPANIYISTNPPVLVPFVVYIYSRITGAPYCYHLQDIHPEATNIVVPINRIAYKILVWIDSLVMRGAGSIITLSDEMRQVILKRSSTSAPIYIIHNPALNVPPVPFDARTGDVVFCGNAGRLQNIPELIQGIKRYLDEGGGLRFTFVGGGVFSGEIEKLSNSYENVEYWGFVAAEDAARIVNQHKWALLPINDVVTRYAFPSKTSSYILSGCNVLAVCGENTSVADWVRYYGAGLTVKAVPDSIASILKIIEGGVAINKNEDAITSLKSQLSIEYFIERVASVLELNRDNVRAKSVQDYKRSQ